MRLLIGEEVVEFSDDDLDYMYVDEGNESEVYQYKDEALKIYKKFCYKKRLDFDEVSLLVDIPTKRILLPKRIIRDFDDLKFRGYTTSFIHSYSKQGIPHMQIEHFLDELEVIESDIRLLADNYVDVSDFFMGNVLYDGNLYLCDPGSFVFRRNSKCGEIYRNNLYELNHFVLDEVFPLVGISKSKRQLYNMEFDDSECLSWQIRDRVVPGETIKQHIKRMTR